MKPRHSAGARLRSSCNILIAVGGCLVLSCSSILAQTAKPENLLGECRVRAYGAKGDGIALSRILIAMPCTQMDLTV
jgi:hypothetical protein